MNRIINQIYPKSSNIVKKFLFLSYIALLAPLAASAQIDAVTLILTPDRIPENDEEFCVGVTTDDWTSIISIETFFSWDADVLEFTGVRDFSNQLPGLGAASFDESGVNQGVLYLDWDEIPCDGMETTLDDDTRIFNICFRAKGTYASSTEIYIPQDTTVVEGGEFLPRAIKKTSCNTNVEANAGLQHANGIISIGVEPLQIISESKAISANTQQVCLAYSVNGFNNILGMQFSINWDPTQLQFSSVIPSENLPNLGQGSFGTPDGAGGVEPGQLTVQWLSSQLINLEGETVEDGTEIFEVCFDVIGDCETDVPVTITDTPTDVQITNQFQDPEENQGLASFITSGLVEIGDCDPTGLNLTADCSVPFDPNNPIDELGIGDMICVSVSSDNFENIREVDHIIEWNENIVTFQGIRNVQNLLQIVDNLFDQSNVARGILGFDYTSPIASTTIPPGVLYEVCFEVTGLGGDSPFNFGGSPTMVARTIGDNFFGINPSGCVIEIPQPPGVTMILPKIEGRPGEEVCMDFPVNNFQDITDAEFTIGWDPNFAELSGNQDLSNLPGAAFLDNPQNSQFFSVQYSGAPVSIPDGESLMTVCFTIKDRIGECDSQVGLRSVANPVNYCKYFFQWRTYWP